MDEVFCTILIRTVFCIASVPDVQAELANTIYRSVSNLQIGFDFEQLHGLFVIGDTADLDLGILVNRRHIMFSKFQCGCVAIRLRQK